MSTQPGRGTAARALPKKPDNALDFNSAVTGLDDAASLADSMRGPDFSAHVPVPHYLSQTYWWAYLHPTAVRVFERQWLVNLILWGNFAELRDAALDEIGCPIEGNVLQVACVYGDFTERIAERLGTNGHVDVVDVAPVQLDNLSSKLKGHPRIALHHQDSTNLGFNDASYDCVVLFFLLHEQPEAARIQTIAQALRVVRPGGKVIFVDYHQPSWANPFKYVMVPILRSLEPFAMDMWRTEIVDWLPENVSPTLVQKETFFGGLYQKVVVTL